jgi:hypothetical protein
MTNQQKQYDVFVKLRGRVETIPASSYLEALTIHAQRRCAEIVELRYEKNKTHALLDNGEIASALLTV